MCGIVGVAGNLFKNDVDVFNQLLYVDVLRGSDSTGVAVVSNDLKDVRVFKRVGPASELMDSKLYDNVVNSQARILLGHNRYGTMGGKTRDNAHPFEFENVVGVHNGTISHTSKGRMYMGSTYGTDSEGIYSNINENGIQDTIAKMKDAQDAYCLIYYDIEDKTLCMIRNEKRPMFFAYDEDRIRIYWASELGMLHWILARNGVKYKTAYHLPENVLFEWEVPKGGTAWPEPEQTPMVPKKEVFQLPGARFQGWKAPHEKAASQSSTEDRDVLGMTSEEWDELQIDDDDPMGWHSNETLDQWRKRTKDLKAQLEQEATSQARAAASNTGLPWDHSNTKGVPKGKDTPTQSFSKDATNVVPIKPVNYLNPVTRLPMTVEEFNIETKNGCDWCSSSINWGDAAQFFRMDSDVEVFCRSCLDGDIELQQYTGKK